MHRLLEEGEQPDMPRRNLGRAGMTEERYLARVAPERSQEREWVLDRLALGTRPRERRGGKRNA